MALKNKKRSKTSKTPREHVLQWEESEFKRGPFRGKFWGTKLDAAFLMIVPRAATKKAPAYYELWFAGTIHDEKKSRTLATAQAFADRVLRQAVDGIAAGLSKLSARTVARAA